MEEGKPQGVGLVARHSLISPRTPILYHSLSSMTLIEATDALTHDTGRGKEVRSIGAGGMRAGLTQYHLCSSGGHR